MIIVTRLNGPPFAVNPDLLERVESTPDTILTLIDGTKYVVTEPVEEVVRRVREFRAAVIASAHRLELTTIQDEAGGPHGSRVDAARPDGRDLDRGDTRPETRPDTERPRLAVAVPLHASRRA